jgi:uncharacterized protein YeaO (DUF488 family)
MPDKGMTTGLARIRVKRAHEPPSPRDGYRILVDRLWPRGLTKDRLQLNLWCKDIAPSHELRRWFGHDPQKWHEFQRKYFVELNANPIAVKTVLSCLQSESVVTLVFGSKEEKLNNAAALKIYFEFPESSRPPKRIS